jgi:hypothetical protein
LDNAGSFEVTSTGGVVILLNGTTVTGNVDISGTGYWIGRDAAATGVWSDREGQSDDPKRRQRGYRRRDELRSKG